MHYVFTEAGRHRTHVDDQVIWWYRRIHD